jgi:hypothetical protein
VGSVSGAENALAPWLFQWPGGAVAVPLPDHHGTWEGFFEKARTCYEYSNVMRSTRSCWYMGLRAALIFFRRKLCPEVKPESSVLSCSCTGLLWCSQRRGSAMQLQKDLDPPS